MQHNNAQEIERAYANKLSLIKSLLGKYFKYEIVVGEPYSEGEDIRMVTLAEMRPEKYWGLKYNPHTKMPYPIVIILLESSDENLFARCVVCADEIIDEIFHCIKAEVFSLARKMSIEASILR